METEDIGEVIAERVLKLSLNGQEPQEVIVRLGKPRPFGGADDYICPFEIETVGDGTRTRMLRCAHGVDAFQALQSAIPMISSMLNGYNTVSPTKNIRSIEIWWLEKGDDLGFGPKSK